jgi:anti-anti-sigma factor
MTTRRIAVLSEAGSDTLLVQSFPVNAWAWIVRLQGSIDSSNVALLEGTLNGIFDRCVARIAIDLGDVPFMSSAAYCCLLAAHDRARRYGGVLVFVRASSTIRDVFSILGFPAGLSFAEDFIEARTRLARQT